MKLVLGLLLGATAFGQTFRDLATTGDGSRLYFSAGLAVSGIYVFDGQAARLFAHDESGPLDGPSASGDGAVVGFNAAPSGKPEARLALASGTVIWSYPGRTAVSRSGRFALFLAAGEQPRATVVDLAGGLGTYAAALPLAAGAGSIASDGAFAAVAPNAVRVVRAAGADTYDAPETPAETVIDDRGAAVAYVAQGRLILLDLTTGAQTTIAEQGTHPRFTDSGEALLYLAPDAGGAQQAWMAPRDGGEARQLTFAAEGILDAAVSGDGKIAYAIAGGSRVLRIDTVSGEVHDLTAALLAIDTEPPRVLAFKIAAGQLCYDVDRARSITIAPGVGAVPPPKACLPAPPAKTAYTLSAANEAGVATASAAAEQTPVQILSFRNDPSFSPVSGGAVTLSWTTQNAERVNMTGLGAPTGALAVNGSAVVHPDTNTSYTLFAYGSNGQAVSVVVYVFVR